MTKPEAIKAIIAVDRYPLLRPSQYRKLVRALKVLGLDASERAEVEECTEYRSAGKLVKWAGRDR